MSAPLVRLSPRIRSAANDALALAQILRLATGQSSYHTRAGHLGFAYMARNDGSLIVPFNWREEWKLVVEQPRSRGRSPRIESYDRAGPWVRELAQAVQSLRECLEARQATTHMGTRH